MANQHILALLVKCMYCACGCVGGCHTSHCTPHKKTEGPNIFFKPKIWHIMYFHIKPSMYPLKFQCKHIHVHITQDISTHKFDCPIEIVTLDKGNCGKAAHIYVNDWCDINP